MNWLGRLFWALLALVVFLFAALAVNQEQIALQFVTWHTPEVSVFWWLLAAFSAGLLIGLIGVAWSTTRLSIKNRGLNKRLTKTERELNKLQQADRLD
jgi:uncharacterized membrane protein YciS (DUF1049 family)